MGNRKIPLSTGEFYHVYLRGVEKRDIVADETDVHRFLESLVYFNATERIGSIYEHSFRIKGSNPESDQFGSPTSKLVDILAYNVLNNHYHLLLRQNVDRGVSKFMQSLNGGYTKYFNNKYERVGPLFQGKFKAEHVSDDNHLVYVSAYVNLNHVVHQLGSPTSKWGWRSSWEQYSDVQPRRYAVPCATSLLLSLRSGKSRYQEEAVEIAEMIAKKRRHEKMSEEEALENYLEVRLPSAK